MVWEANENPSSVSQTSVSPRYEYDQSVKAMDEVPALSPQSTLLAQSAQPAEYPLTALVALSVAMAPLKAESPPKQHVVLQA